MLADRWLPNEAVFITTTGIVVRSKGSAIQNQQALSQFKVGAIRQSQT